MTELQPVDQRIWEEELDAFVPAHVFDAHTHLWNDCFADTHPDPTSPLRQNVDVASLGAVSAGLFPDRTVDFLLLATPLPGIDVDGHNAWMGEQAQLAPASRAAALVTPDMTASALDALIRRHGFSGMKPYRSFAPDPAQARIVDYLPETLMEVADQHAMTITLHLSRVEGPADPENLRDLTDYAARYPRVRWILAHVARAFNPVFLEKALPVLTDIPTVWFDTSAVTDVYAHYLLFKHADRRRILFGTDNAAVGVSRGTFVQYAFAWDYFPGWPDRPHCSAAPTFVVYEQLRAQRRAAEMAGMTQGDIDDLFRGNAARLFGLKEN